MVPTEPQTEIRNFVFCDHYKKLIVEDFVLNENRENLHYGKCAVIGYVTFDGGLYYLGNIRITSLKSDAQLPDNTLKTLLLTNLCTQSPPIERTVEIFGESVLYDKTVVFSDEVSSIPCTTSLDVFRNRSAAGKIASDEYYRSYVNSTYVPAIKVHHIVPMQDAHEMINCNLRLKLVMEKI